MTKRLMGMVLAAACLASGTGRASADVDEALALLGAEAGTPAVRYVDGAAWPAFGRGFRTPPLGATAEEAALAFVERYLPIFGLVDAGDAAFMAGVPWRGRTIVRLQESFAGLPVFGREAAVRVEPDGSVSMFASNMLPVDGIPAEPAIGALEAGAVAVSFVSWPSGVESAVLGVWFVGQEPRLAWSVSVRGAGDRAAILMVDASSGAIVGAGSPILHARARVFVENPVEDGEVPTEVDILRLAGDATTLTGENTAAWLFVPGGTPVQTAVADVSGDFFYDPIMMADEPSFDDPFAQVNAYYHMDTTSEYFQTTHGYVQSRGPISVFTNYVQNAGEAYENAFFDGESWSISLGQAETGDFSYDAETMYHEFTHSVIDSVAHLVYMAGDPLGMIVFPGALHEGISDTFAVSLTGDPNMGEYIMGRNLVNSRTCPTNIMGEVHYDGEIVGGANWDIHEVIGPDALESTSYGALTTLVPTSSFAEYSEGVVAALEVLEADGDLTSAQVDAVVDILHERGMDVCTRIMSLDGDLSYTMTLFGLDMYGACDMLGLARSADLSFPPAFQWTVFVPEDATSLSFDPGIVITGSPSPDDYDVWVHMRVGGYVQYEMVDMFGMQMPLRIQTADESYEDPAGAIVFTEHTDPPLQPGEQYYFTVNYLGCPMGTSTVSATVGFEPVENPEPVVEEEPEIGPEPDDDDASADAGPDAGEIRVRGGACGCALVR